MPILKQLVSGSSQSKRRSRADLTAEMISAPLGDFRHTMHVGRGGDAFGDTSFLSSRSGEPPRDSQPQQISPKQGPNLPKSVSSSPHAESILSFHVDLGPSMLGDILGVMDKKVWDEADFGYEDDHGSPASRPVRETCSRNTDCPLQVCLMIESLF
uniref:CRIB domain-containing protein n=1 Tax=Pygocentrus nattereri TaxID=42514 RepID=A0AAR2L0Q3_PYGNA